MTSQKTALLLAGLWAAAGSLLAQTAETPPPAVPALEAGVNVQVVLTSTGAEKAVGPAAAKVYSADFDVARLNTRGFIELLDRKYDLVAQPKDFSLVAVLVDTDTEHGYRFYLKNRAPSGTPAYVYLAPEALGLTIDATATRYREVQDGDVILSGGGACRHAVTLASAGFSTRGLARGEYKIRNVTVGDVTRRLNVLSAVQVETSGFYEEGAGTPEAKTVIAETSWIFTASKAVNLNDYPAPPPPAPAP